MAKRRTSEDGPRVPKLRLHKPSGRALVELPGGRRIYLGKYGTQECALAYERFRDEYVGAGYRLPPEPGPGLTVSDLIADYVQHAEDRYGRKEDGSPKGELRVVLCSFREILHLYEDLPAADFRAKHLEAVQVAMIGEPGTRMASTISKYIAHIRRAFKRAVTREIIDGKRLDALKSVESLRSDDPRLRPPEKVRPVPAGDVWKTVEELPSSILKAAVVLQYWTGARSDELLSLRPCDIVDRSDPEAWEWIVPHHKTMRLGDVRRIWIGRPAQTALAPLLLGRDAEAYVFSPKEAIAEMDHKPLAPGKGMKGEPGDRYRVDTFRQAVQRAAKRAGVSRWHPHQLRHLRATEIAREHGKEAAKVFLGHREIDVTEDYIEPDAKLARDVARAQGA